MYVLFFPEAGNILTEIFSSPDRPFYNITEMMEISSIEPEIYKVFIKDKFKKGSISIYDTALDRIVEITGLHTFYVQYFCNRLYSEHKSIGNDDVDQTLITILRENEPVYASYLNLLTTMQYRVLKAIAQNDGIDNPLSKEFLSKYNLGAASSVSQAIKSLSEKEFVFYSKNRYRLNDVFLAQWIIYKTS
jgi:RecG-like helicase